jgi:hypothetical protein
MLSMKVTFRQKKNQHNRYNKATQEELIKIYGIEM